MTGKAIAILQQDADERRREARRVRYKSALLKHYQNLPYICELSELARGELDDLVTRTFFDAKMREVESVLAGLTGKGIPGMPNYTEVVPTPIGPLDHLPPDLRQKMLNGDWYHGETDE